MALLPRRLDPTENRSPTGSRRVPRVRCAERLWRGVRRSHLRVVLLAAFALGFGFVLHRRQSDIAAFVHTFAQTDMSWLLAAVVFNLLSAVAGALAWQTVINEAMPPPRPRFRLVFSAFCVGLLGNVLLPGRAGEMARVAVLARRLPGRSGIWATLIGTVFAYRLLDFVPTTVLVGYVVVFAPVPRWAVVSTACVLAIGAAFFAAGVLLARRHERPLPKTAGTVRALVLNARQGLGVLRTPHAALRGMLFEGLAWICQLLAVFATLRAFTLDVPLSAAALVLVMINLAVLFPFWPGNVGLVQAAVALPLLGYGVDYAQGIAFGVGLQVVEFSVGISLGLLFLTHEGLSLATLKRVPARVDP
jgi:uncharacterized membrane protein YbhN (UPF0104 family)